MDPMSHSCVCDCKYIADLTQIMSAVDEAQAFLQYAAKEIESVRQGQCVVLDPGKPQHWLFAFGVAFFLFLMIRILGARVDDEQPVKAVQGQ